MNNMLENKRILIFVSGSIAIYKILELIRLLRKSRALVRVVASKNALRFINPITFEALSETTLLHDGNEEWSQDSQNHMSENYTKRNHIDYAKWAQLALFAPATANTINKLAHGIADNTLLSTALALREIPKLLAPSANTFMLHNNFTQQNLENLELNGFKIIKSRSDLLACGDRGDGALADVDEILFNITKAIYNFYPIKIDSGDLCNTDNPKHLFVCSSFIACSDSKILSHFWRNKDVIITGGGSIESIDDVRYISNNSSGLQASNLALALYCLGAKVRFITSKVPMTLPLDIEIINVKTSKDYKDSIYKVMESINVADSQWHIDSKVPADCIYHARDCKDSQNPMRSNSKIYLFMVAAISDYVPQKQEGKIKKSSTGKHLRLTLSENIDILKSISDERVVKIAFKAECDDAEDSKNAIQNARKILDYKNCNAVCLNIINEKNKVFGEGENEIYFITKDVESKFIGSKFDISMQICNKIKFYI